MIIFNIPFELSVLSVRIDSIMLVEEGFQVVSVDASDKMLKYALKERWERRKEPGFDNWGKAIENQLIFQWSFELILVVFVFCTQSSRREIG